MITNMTLQELIKQITFYKNIFAYCLNDIEKINQYDNVIYNIDFQFLFPYLFPDSVKNTKPFLPQYEKIFKSLSLAKEHNVKFSLAFSGASFLELLDQIEHRRNYYRYSLKELNNYCDKYANGQKLLSNFEMLAKRKDILASLNLISKDGYDNSITTPINKMVSLIKGESIIPIGEFISDEVIGSDFYKRKYLADLDSITKNRLSKETTRSEKDSLFHYKVDALNILLSYAINRELSENYLLFITSQRENLLLCKSEDDSFGRNPYVPLFLLNAVILKERKYINSRKDFIEEALLHADKIINKLEGKGGIEDIPLFDFKKILEFYEYYIHSLNQETLNLQKNETQPSKEEIMAVLSNPSKLQSSFEKAEETLIETASNLYEYYKEFDDKVIGYFELEEDVIVRKIKYNLGLK